MRFEWIDMLIRICIHKYLLNSKPAASVAEAFEKLFQINVLPTQPPEGLTDKDTFRRQRLYKCVARLCEHALLCWWLRLIYCTALLMAYGSSQQTC